MSNIELVADFYAISRVPFVIGTSVSGTWCPAPLEHASCCDRVHSADLKEHCYSREHLRTRLSEKPRPNTEVTALNMTIEDAPLYLVHYKGSLLEYVALKLLTT